MDNQITSERLERYFTVTRRALDLASQAINPAHEKQARDTYDMAWRYVQDAQHFFEKGNWVLAFAALNYAHGWLDAGARLRLFLVTDSTLFTVDGEEE